VEKKIIGKSFDLSDNDILISMDEQSQRSLNGVRVSTYLMNNIANYENFAITLKCIKLWAKNRGIYC